MTPERIRIELGFSGGQIIALQVTPGDADRLERHLGSGNGGSISVDVEEGRCVIVPGQVLYMKRFARESRVGFGG